MTAHRGTCSPFGQQSGAGVEAVQAQCELLAAHLDRAGEGSCVPAGGQWPQLCLISRRDVVHRLDEGAGAASGALLSFSAAGHELVGAARAQLRGRSGQAAARRISRTFT